jgi:hypothetical protein
MVGDGELYTSNLLADLELNKAYTTPLSGHSAFVSSILKSLVIDSDNAFAVHKQDFLNGSLVSCLHDKCTEEDKKMYYQFVSSQIINYALQFLHVCSTTCCDIVLESIGLEL